MTSAALPRHRRALFTAIVLLLPLAVLAGLELTLRAAGVAAPEPLFVAAPEPGWLQPNERVIRRYFADPDAAPPVSIDTGYFRARKPDGAFRAVVLGESSAAGFPYGKWASLGGILEQRWRREHPFRVVEVISVAMSAVNSWTLADFAAEVLALEPDAVLVYTGHNEYLGVLGVGSAYGGRAPALTRVLLALRNVRLLALANRAWAALSRTDRAADSGTLMARVAAERSIPLDSPLYSAGLQQFATNMDRLLSECAAADVPTFVGTLASNERDQQPFATVAPAESRGAWLRRVADGEKAFAAGNLRAAEKAAATLVDGAPLAPDGYWLRGRVLLAAGRPADARRDFLAAKDRDPLRFRAPEAFNGIIRAAAARHGATVVEVQDALAARSPDGIIGAELMLEHLHPNHEGYFLLAERFHDALAEAGLPWRGGLVLDDVTARAEAPLTEVERLAGEYRLLRLKSDWPFHEVRQPLQLPEPRSEPEQIARAWFEAKIDWPEAMNRALAHYQRAGRTAEAAKVAVNLAHAFPFRGDAQYIAGSLLMRDERADRALPFLHAAASAAPRDPRYLMALAQAYYLAGRIDDSLQVLRRVLAIEPGHPTAADFVSRLESERRGGG